MAVTTTAELERKAREYVEQVVWVALSQKNSAERLGEQYSPVVEIVVHAGTNGTQASISVTTDVHFMYGSTGYAQMGDYTNGCWQGVTIEIGSGHTGRIVAITDVDGEPDVVENWGW